MENQTDGGMQYRGENEFAAANETSWSGGGNLREDLETRMDDARHALARADQTLRETVRERPFMAVGMALAIGYLISRGLARH